MGRQIDAFDVQYWRRIQLMNASEYKYLYIYCDNCFTNSEFARVLKLIGAYGLEERFEVSDNASFNQICSALSKQINHDLRLNGFRKRIKQSRVSKNQIKAILCSFINPTNGKSFVKIPFNVVPIFFYIICLLRTIVDAHHLNDYRDEFKLKTINEFFYTAHYKLFVKKMGEFANVTDPVYQERLDRLNQNLTGEHTFMNCKYKAIEWHHNHHYIP